MGTYVITGGTDGTGRALALRLLRDGNRVIAVASGEAKGRAYLDDVRRAGYIGRADLIQADLSTIAGCEQVVREVTTTVNAVDGLILAAQLFQPRRVETRDGLEFTFALMYLSRFLLGHDLHDHLDRGDNPLVVNIAAPGSGVGDIGWDDLQLHDGYKGWKAMFQASRANDLLAVDFATRHPDSRVRYQLHNPGFVRSGMADPLPQPARTLTTVMAALFASSPTTVAARITARMADPPPEPLSAFTRGRRLALDGAAFDPAGAGRLHSITRELLAARA